MNKEQVRGQTMRQVVTYKVKNNEKGSLLGEV